MYRMQLTDKQWLLFSIIGDLGIAAYDICILIMMFYLKYMMADMTFVISAALVMISGFFIILGIVDILVAKHKHKIRMMSKGDLFSGFGMVTVATFAAFVFSLLTFCVNHTPPEMHMRPVLAVMMAGALVGFVFSYIIFRGFREVDPDEEL